MKIFRLLSLLLVVLLASCLNKKKSADTGIPGNESRYVVLAYVTSWGVSTPETSCLTHINYAFGHVADDNKGIRIDNEPRLQMIVGLKKEKPSLKVLLSVGGWGSSRFSEMAANDSTRTAFAADCRRVIDKFGLDGIDIDWEYPGSGTAGISFSSADKENFTLLMRDVRQAVGKDKLLTIATAATGRYYDFRAIEPYVDYVNIMAYDMEEAPFHHAALHCSDMTEEWSCEKAVAGILPVVFRYSVWYWGFLSMGMEPTRRLSLWIIAISYLSTVCIVAGIVWHKFLIWLIPKEQSS